MESRGDIELESLQKKERSKTEIKSKKEKEIDNLFNNAVSISSKIRQVKSKPKKNTLESGLSKSTSPESKKSYGNRLSEFGTSAKESLKLFGTSTKESLKSVGTNFISSTKNKIGKLATWLKKNEKKIDITPLNIKNFKNINQYVKKDFIYIDITNLLGEKFITEIAHPNCFKINPLLKTIVYSLTSNNKRDKARIIYFLESLNNSSISSSSSSSSGTSKCLYVYNTKEYTSFAKRI